MPEFAVTPSLPEDPAKCLTDLELAQALRFFVAAEYEAIQIYEQLVSRLPDGFYKEAIQGIIEDEKDHSRIFLALIQSTTGELDSPEQPDELVSEQLDMVVDLEDLEELIEGVLEHLKGDFVGSPSPSETGVTELVEEDLEKAVLAPGSRGGKFYYGEKGEVYYGDKPSKHSELSHLAAEKTGKPLNISIWTKAQELAEKGDEKGDHVKLMETYKALVEKHEKSIKSPPEHVKTAHGEDQGRWKRAIGLSTGEDGSVNMGSAIAIYRNSMKKLDRVKEYLSNAKTIAVDTDYDGVIEAAKEKIKNFSGNQVTTADISDSEHAIIFPWGYLIADQSKPEGKQWSVFEKDLSMAKAFYFESLSKGMKLPPKSSLERLDFQGLKIRIENPKGSVRKGESEEGKAWKTKMFYPYGFIEKTKGADGDEVDVYIGPNSEASMVYIVNQKDPETGEFDEVKVMLGFDSKLHARDGYLAHYDTHEFLGTIDTMPMSKFKHILEERGGI